MFLTDYTDDGGYENRNEYILIRNERLAPEVPH
jgi:hypothetical protein